MTRRNSSGSLVTGARKPDELARSVVNRYVEEANKNLSVWAGKYASGIQAYINNPQAIRATINKLSHWYSLLIEIIPRVREIYATAKIEYYRRLYAPSAAQASQQQGQRS